MKLIILIYHNFKMEEIEEMNMESSVEEDDDEKSWNIKYEDEKKLWTTKIIHEYIYETDICPACKCKSLKLKENKNQNILNPFFLRCSTKNCRRKYNLRHFSFFKLHKTLPASILLYVINEFIIMNSNAKEIKNRIKMKFKFDINYNTLLDILLNIRKVIADFYKHLYRSKKIGGDPSTGIIVAVDESMFVHAEDGSQIWIVGAVETVSKKKRFDIIKQRNSQNLKIFAMNHIEPGTHITHDGWTGYTFWGDDDLLCTEEVHNHGGGDFGVGVHSTSNIEHTWAQMKNKILSIYNIIPKNHFIYFFREAELRLSIAKLTNEKKEIIFKKILKNVYLLNEFDFYTEDEIISFDNYDI